jgi:hypothetical protein
LSRITKETAIGQIAAGLGWRAIRTRADFDRVQTSAEPLVVSLRR